MAESFNELDDQHEWEEITHTHAYKGYKHSTHCAMIHHSTSTNTGNIDISPGLAMPEFL